MIEMLRCFVTYGGYTMADDKTKKGPADASKVNVHEDYEVQYWRTKFGCTPQQLKDAVKKVGTVAAAVEKELKNK
jgi:Protein of unknown function (DUF3606)